jgi:exopolysaccharide production protein ExoQ
MPPSLATLLTLAFVLFLFAQDSRRGGRVSGALWLPVLWLAITGSRFVSQWISLGEAGSVGVGDDVTEGSPIDAVYFITLILIGVSVLVRRRIIVGAIVRKNPWLMAFFLYSFVAILWSDFPFIAFKHWIKTLGHPVMALIILTDPDPVNALRTVMKRCAYLLIPFSVLFIKYFPEYGRGFDAFSGEAINRGVGLTKNDLGYLCMVFGLFFFWNLVTTGRTNESRLARGELALNVAFLGMIGWLLQQANSATSLSTLVLGVVTIVVLGLQLVNKRYIGACVIVGGLVAVGAELAFGVYAELPALLGRDPTLTGRTEVWEDVLALQDSPILGTGFESFWLGPRLETLWAKWWWHPIQAHNGYLETYLNLGAVGVFLLLGVILATFRKITRGLSTDFDFARLRLGFLFAILAFNFTEAAFKAVHLVWTMFHIIAIDYPKPGHRAR